MNINSEIQFNETISCFCFANERGDLLVGIKDQISLVRVQDCNDSFLKFYRFPFQLDMPYNFLRCLLTMNFEDDKQEFAIAFDPNLDFWEYHYNEQIQKNNSVSEWHITK